VAIVLVLDDDSEVRQIVTTALQEQGHEAFPVGTLEKAREAVKGRKPDLILMDLILPDGDGLAFLSQLQAEEKTQSIPVVLVSALRQKKKIVEGLNAGAVDYITKPFDLVELRVRVTAALKIHELRQAESKNRDLDAMRETAKTVQYEIELPMQEIQRCLIQLSNESDGFPPNDQQLLEEARNHFAKLETILSKAQYQ